MAEELPEVENLEPICELNHVLMRPEKQGLLLPQTRFILIDVITKYTTPWRIYAHESNCHYCRGALFLCCVLWARGANWSAAPIQTFGTFFLAVAFAGLTYLAGATDSGIARVFSTRRLRMFGKYSYTIYVIHVLIANHVSLGNGHADQEDRTVALLGATHRFGGRRCPVIRHRSALLEILRESHPEAQKTLRRPAGNLRPGLDIVSAKRGE